MQYKYLSAVTLSVVVHFFPFTAHAELITSGFTITPVGGSSDYIEVGGGQNGLVAYDGTLEINASPDGNGITSLTATYINIAYGEKTTAVFDEGLSYSLYGQGVTGRVTVKGDGTSGSAKLITTGDSPTFPGLGLYNGLGNGILNIINGGVIEAQGGNILFGGPSLYDDTPGPTVATIDGKGSILRTQQAQQDTEGNGGLILIGGPGTFSPRDTRVDITNGGLMEALNDDNTVPDSGCSYWGGNVFINGGLIDNSSTTVNVDGEGSILRADNYLRIGNADGGAAAAGKNTTAQLNITNGGAVEVTYGLLDETYFGDVDMSVAVLPVDGAEAVVHINGDGSSLSVDQLEIGGLTAVVGFTKTGFPVYDVDSDILQSYEPGDHIRDNEGNLLYDNFGNPVLAVKIGSGEDSYINASTTVDSTNPAFTKMSGTVIVENGASLHAKRIDVSINDDQALVYDKQSASLTVRNNGVVDGAVNVYQDGLLNGDGLIVGDVLIDGGIVSPGNSPGELNIEGNLDLLSGFAELEIGDLLSVTGNLTIGSDFIFTLLFDPDNAERLGLMDSEGLYSIILEIFFNVSGRLIVQDGFSLEDNLKIVGLDDGQELSISFLGDQATFVGSPVPLPSTIWMLGSCIVGMIGYRRVSLSRHQQ